MATGIDTLLVLRNQLRQSIAILEDEIQKHLTSWQSKCLYGFTIEAIKQYREMNGCTLTEARDAVASFRDSFKEEIK